LIKRKAMVKKIRWIRRETNVKGGREEDVKK
jgi:hypothetical protein